LVSLPPAWAGLLGPRARTWSRSTVLDAAALMDELRDIPVQRTIGPAFIGYTTATSFTRSQIATARALTSTDAQSVEALRASCTPKEWEHGGSIFGEMPRFGAFDKVGELAALRGYQVWAETIQHTVLVLRPV